MQPPQGLVEKVKGLGKLKRLADSMPKTVSQRRLPGARARARPRRAPDPALLAGRPRALHHAAGRDHEGPAHRQPQRRHVPDAEDRRAHDASCTGRSTRTAAPTGAAWASGSIPVAVALGLDPVTAYSASAPLPKHIDEFMLAGFLRGEPVETREGARPSTSRCRPTPRSSSRGTIEAGDMGTEGPFGDHTGYYSPPEPFPVFHLTRDDDAPRRDLPVDRRRRSRRPRTPGSGKATERIFLPAHPHDRARDRRLRPTGRRRVPQLRDRLDPQGVPGPREEGHARRSGGWACSSLSKSVVVVDELVDVHDYEQVFFHVCANVDPKRDVLLTEGPLDQLDHAAMLHCYGGKLGIDATHKLPEEGARAWPRAHRDDAGRP